MTINNAAAKDHAGWFDPNLLKNQALAVPPNTAFETIADLEQSALYNVNGIHARLTPSALFTAAPMEIFYRLPQMLYDRTKWRWTRFPDLSHAFADGERERLVAFFLNDLYEHCRQWLVTRRRPMPVEERRWLPAVTARLRPDGTQDSMLCIVLVPSGSEVEWSTTLCDAQVVSSTDLIPEAVRNLSTTASYVFASQDNCLYHIGLVFAGAEFTIVIHDRAGRAQYIPRQVHKHGSLIAMLMAILAFTDTTPLGRDPTMQTRADGTRSLTVNGVEYEIVERLFGSPHVRGRGTVCWRCRRPGSDNDFVIKSAWIDSRRTDTEAFFLKEAAGVFGVPELLDHEIVVGADGTRISTNRFRDCLRVAGRFSELQNVETLELHRLVMRPYALPLTEFRSKEELLSGMRDGVAAHWGLWDDRGILHCDISENNIMLRLDEPEEPLRRGILIDLDCATHVYGRNKVGPRSHSAGTLPYISCTRLLRPGVPHYAVHDLESFLYVLMWICTSYRGPLRARVEPFDPYQTPLGKWQTSRDEKEVGQQKWDIMYVKTESEFRAFLDETFDPYFDDLKDCVCELRRAILFSHGRVTHEDVLDILEMHICAQQPPERRREPTKLKPEGAEPLWCTPDPECATKTQEDTGSNDEEEGDEDQDEEVDDEADDKPRLDVESVAGAGKAPSPATPSASGPSSTPVNVPSLASRPSSPWQVEPQKRRRDSAVVADTHNVPKRRRVSDCSQT